MVLRTMGQSLMLREKRQFLNPEACYGTKSSRLDKKLARSSTDYIYCSTCRRTPGIQLGVAVAGSRTPSRWTRRSSHQRRRRPLLSVMICVAVSAVRNPGDFRCQTRALICTQDRAVPGPSSASRCVRAAGENSAPPTGVEFGFGWAARSLWIGPCAAHHPLVA